MNILELAKSWGIKTNNPVTRTECIEAFAAAVIEDYKASLVPVAWVCGGELYLTLYKANEGKRDWSLVAVPLYALPKETP